jgi:hypothetical protein
MFTFWQVSTFGTIIVYGFLYDWRIISIWLAFCVGYTVLGLLQGHSKANSNRAKIRMATWNPPTDPNCYVKIEINCKKVAESDGRSMNSSRRNFLKASR